MSDEPGHVGGRYAEWTNGTFRALREGPGGQEYEEEARETRRVVELQDAPDAGESSVTGEGPTENAESAEDARATAPSPVPSEGAGPLTPRIAPSPVALMASVDDSAEPRLIRQEPGLIRREPGLIWQEPPIPERDETREAGVDEPVVGAGEAIPVEAARPLEDGHFEAGAPESEKQWFAEPDELRISTHAPIALDAAESGAFETDPGAGEEGGDANEPAGVLAGLAAHRRISGRVLLGGLGALLAAASIAVLLPSRARTSAAAAAPLEVGEVGALSIPPVPPAPTIGAPRAPSLAPRLASVPAAASTASSGVRADSTRALSPFSSIVAAEPGSIESPGSASPRTGRGDRPRATQPPGRASAGASVDPHGEHQLKVEE